MAENTLDEYKPVKFYAENTTPKKAGFSKFKDGDSYYFCRYSDNKIVLLSQAYTGQPGRDNGIESVKKNEKLAKRYRFDTHGKSAHGFSLRAGNGLEIAVSPSYGSLGDAQKAASRLSGASFSSTASTKTSSVKKAAPLKVAPKKAVAKKVKPKAASEEQNYQSLAFYRRHTKGKNKGFEKFHGDDGEHYFTYFENSKLALISEGYPTAAIRDVGLASVEKNMKIEKRYVQGTGAEGKPGFILRAGNHKEIARSVGYGSAAAATAGAAYLLGTRRRATAAPKKATVKKATVKKAAVKKAAPKPRTVKPVVKNKSAVKAAAPLAAASVVAAGLAAKKSKPKVTKVKKVSIPVKAAAVKPAPKPPVPKKALAAGSVAVAGLGAKAASAKASGVKAASVPVKAAAIVAAPIAVAAIAAAAIVTPKAEPKPEPKAAAVAAPIKAVAPVAAVSAAATAAAPVAGAGIWGWLKWLLLALLALFALLFLFKACLGDSKEVATTAPAVIETAAPAAVMVTCWNGSKAKDDEACPAKVTCWDNSFATSKTSCPVKPAAKDFDCWDGSKAVDQFGCPVKEVKAKPTKMTAPSVEGRICGSSPITLFDVRNSTPISVGRLGTNPQFGNSLGMSSDEFFEKLRVQYLVSQDDKSFLDYMARSLGYGAFSDMNASMFTNDVLAKGTSGNLGFGTSHALQFSTLNVSDPTHLEAFKVRSANGTDIHFMKRCGNFMYVCQP